MEEKTHKASRLRAMTHIKQIKNAFYIQAHHRCYKAYSFYKSLQYPKNAALCIQCSWRCKLARKELRCLRKAAMPNCPWGTPKWKDELEKRVEVLKFFVEGEKLKRRELKEKKTRNRAELECEIRRIQMNIDKANTLVIKELLVHHQLSRRRNSNI